MKSNFFLRLIICCLLSFAVLPARATELTEASARRWAETKGGLLLETFNIQDLSRKYAELDRLLLENVDLDYIGSFVVGRYQKDMTPEQAARYKEIFRRFALASYKRFPLNFENKINFSIVNSTVNGDQARVTALIDLGDFMKDEQGNPQNILVEFRLRQTDGALKLIDLKVAESSLILAYRNVFYQMIAKNDGDMEWFLEDLEDQTSSTEIDNQRRLNAAGQDKY